MALTKQEWIRLEEKADELRKLCLYTTHCSSGHIGGSMSAADVLTALYYKYMNFDPKNPDDPDRDRCVVSKGHIGIFLAGMFADLGLVDKKNSKLSTLPAAVSVCTLTATRSKVLTHPPVRWDTVPRLLSAWLMRHVLTNKTTPRTL